MTTYAPPSEGRYGTLISQPKLGFSTREAVWMLYQWCKTLESGEWTQMAIALPAINALKAPHTPSSIVKFLNLSGATGKTALSTL